MVSTAPWCCYNGCMGSYQVVGDGALYKYISVLCVHVTLCPEVITLVVMYRSITRTYYRNSVGALVVFDVCNKKSLEHVPMWIMEAKRHIEPHKAVFILVGTKVSSP